MQKKRRRCVGDKSIADTSRIIAPREIRMIANLAEVLGKELTREGRNTTSVRQ